MKSAAALFGAAGSGGDDPQTPLHAFGGTMSRRESSGTSPFWSKPSSSCAAVNGGGRVMVGSVIVGSGTFREGNVVDERTVVRVTCRPVVDDSGGGFAFAFASASLCL
jgi:hypothetical protein